MKYHPIQLNSTVNYAESQPPNWLSNKVVCFWEIKTKSLQTDYPVIPDGCVDLVVNCTSRNQSFISPSLINSEIFTLGGNETWFGVRFYPGVLSQVLRIGLSELQFKTTELEDIKVELSRQISETLKGAKSLNERANKLTYLLSKIGFVTEQNNENKELPLKTVALNFRLDPKGHLYLFLPSCSSPLLCVFTNKLSE